MSAVYQALGGEVGAIKIIDDNGIKLVVGAGIDFGFEAAYKGFALPWDSRYRG